MRSLTTFVLLLLVAPASCSVPATADAGAAGGNAGGSAGGGDPRAGGTGGGSPCYLSGAGGAVYVGSWNVFVSSVQTNGDFAGTTGGELFCSRLAAAAGRPSALAYVSVAGELPVQAFIRQGYAEPAGVFWYGPPWSNEHGQEVRDLSLWAGHQFACVSAESCSGWRSSSPNEYGVTVPRYPSMSQRAFNLPVPEWPDAGRAPCDSRHSVLCVHYDPVFSAMPPPPLPPPTKRMFISHSQFTGDLGGLSGADQRCLDLARDGGLVGSWRAFLSTASAPFSIDGGHSWAPRPADDAGAVFQTVQNLGTTPRRLFAVDERGMPLDSGALWTGTKLWMTASPFDCSGWTRVDAGGTAGSLDRLDETWSDDGVASCATPAHLLCLEL